MARIVSRSSGAMKERSDVLLWVVIESDCTEMMSTSKAASGDSKFLGRGKM